MSHYYKLAFTTFRITGILITIYALLSSTYVLIAARVAMWAAPPMPDNFFARFIPVFFYMLLGILVFAFSKQLAKLAVKGIDPE